MKAKKTAQSKIILDDARHLLKNTPTRRQVYPASGRAGAGDEHPDRRGRASVADERGTIMKQIIIIVAALAVTGCATPITQPASSVSMPEHVVKKSYLIGQTNTVFVGDALVKVQDYTTVKSSKEMLRATENFTISGGLFGWVMNVTGKKMATSGLSGRSRGRAVTCNL
jgi:hypothetical protein